MISFDDPPQLATHASWAFVVVPVGLVILGVYTASMLKPSALSLSIRSRSDDGLLPHSSVRLLMLLL